MSANEIDDLPNIDGVSPPPLEGEEGSAHEGEEHDGGEESREEEEIEEEAPPALDANLPKQKPLNDLFGGLISPHDNYRLMSYLFFAALVGVIITFAVTMNHFFLDDQFAKKIEIKTAQQLEKEKELKALAEHNSHKDPKDKKGPALSDSLSLGVFNFELKKSGLSKKPDAAVGAEVEVEINCDTGETCESLKEALPVLRDRISNIFFKCTQNDLMTRDGKTRLRKQIVDSVNDWLTEAKVKDAFFTHIVLL